MVSDLMNALLSPKHSLRHKRTHSKTTTRTSVGKEASLGESSGSEMTDPCGSVSNHELVRALSDGSLTNTSTGTVVEFVNDGDDAAGTASNKAEDSKTTATTNPIKHNGLAGPPPSDDPNRRCLSDVFCQTSFSDLLDKPIRRYRHHHKQSCRCRPLKSSRTHTKHCRRHHVCSHHAECCPTQGGLGHVCASEKTCRSVWLTSSTSDHSLSSLSSSTSTLSETSTMRTSSVLSNDATTFRPPQHFCASISPFGGESVSSFGKSDTYREDSALVGILSGRSPISTERLFRSAENNFQPLTGETTNCDFSLFEALASDKSATTSLDNFPEKSASQFAEEVNSDMFRSSKFRIVHSQGVINCNCPFR